jgi:peptidoglycan/LPS O-acetylase OafA/YrhL
MAEAATDRYLPAATGLRGVAAGWVVLYHGWQLSGAPRPMLGPLDLTPLLATGYFGVDLFFVLSGFLLGLPFLAAARERRRVDLGRFWINRCRRVLPAYWAQLLLLVPIAALSGAAAFDLGDLLRHATLLFNLQGNASLYNAVHWSLPVEWNFYMVLPLLALPFARRGGALAALLGMLAFALAFRIACVAVVFAWGETGVAIYQWIIQLPGRLDQFAFGMAAAWCHLHGWPRRGHGVLAALGLALLLALCWGVAPRGDIVGNADAPWLYVHFGAVALAFALVLLAAVARPQAWYARLLAAAPLAWLGMVSYSLYLWHLQMLEWQLDLLHGGARSTTAVLLCLPGVLLMAWASYRFVERPFLGARARRAEGRGAQPLSG